MKDELIVLLPKVPGYSQCARCGDQWEDGYKYGCRLIEGEGMVCFDCTENEETEDEG